MNSMYWDPGSYNLLLSHKVWNYTRKRKVINSSVKSPGLMGAHLNRCRSGNSVLKLEVRNSDRLHGLITLQHQFANLLEHLTFDAQQLAVPLVRLADAGLVSRLSFHCLWERKRQTKEIWRLATTRRNRPFFCTSKETWWWTKLGVKSSYSTYIPAPTSLLILTSCGGGLLLNSVRHGCLFTYHFAMQ